MHRKRFKSPPRGLAYQRAVRLAGTNPAKYSRMRSPHLLGAILLAVTPACGGKTAIETTELGPDVGASGNAGQGGTGNAGSGGSGQAGSNVGGHSGVGGHGGSAGHAGSAQGTWCTTATPVLVNGQNTGFFTCQDGREVRRETVTCPVVGPELPGSCGSDADCPNEQLCQCDVNGGHCVHAQCASSGDCPGQECTFFSDDPGGPCTNGKSGFACTSAQDTCTGDSCLGGEHCSPGTGVVWTCRQTEFCGVGRPLRIEEAPRFAALLRGLDWG